MTTRQLPAGSTPGTGTFGPVRTAVFPAAGFGTRMLPATKSVPKEMLTVVDRPVIQYGVEEAVASGISKIVVITAAGKGAMEDHFDASRELEHVLERKGDEANLAVIRGVASMARMSYVRQAHALGLGHAVLLTEPLVGHVPFAVFLPDDIMDGGHDPVMAQLMRVYDEHRCSVIAVERVPMEHVSRYGVLDVESVGPRLHRIKDMVEKPAVGTAPSNLAIMGRYILTPTIFEKLRETTPGAGGEIQLTDGIRRLLAEETVLACEYVGTRYDCGTKLGYLRANVEMALRHPDLGPSVHELLTDILGRS